MELSIVIVNFNTKDLIRTCLDSIKKWSDGAVWEIIVVDNGSTDESVETLKKFTGITLILNKKNEGFAKANNCGIKIAKGKYILLLNSDTEIRQDSIQTMLRFMDGHLKAGASTCRLDLVSGVMDPACHRGFPTPWASFTYMVGLEKLFPSSHIFARYHMGYKNMTIPHQVDCISGAFFMVRREAVEQVGLLDEDYFMYAEDIDWAYRFKQKGWEVWFNPEASVFHKKKQSGRSHTARSQRIETEQYFHKSNWLFYKKHYEKKYGPIVSLCINLFYRIRLATL
ncbi:MAG: glycosyltransferase family 2 protein [Candidatus Gottesmanbacteria bacterium]|nr:glycosyltransferase family 2 protein [Candidatus Gottesmanbacteria bacterium]